MRPKHTELYRRHKRLSILYLLPPLPPPPLFSLYSLHSFVSFSGFSEAYWQLFFTDDSSKFHLSYLCNVETSISTTNIDETPPFSRRQVANMFFKGELEDELRDDKYPGRSEWVMCNEGDVEKIMKQVVEEHSEEMYPHHPSKDCSARGEIRYPHTHTALEWQALELAFASLLYLYTLNTAIACLSFALFSRPASMQRVSKPLAVMLCRSLWQQSNALCIFCARLH